MFNAFRILSLLKALILSEMEHMCRHGKTPLVSLYPQRVPPDTLVSQLKLFISIA